MSQTAHLTMTVKTAIFPACQWHTEGEPFTTRSYSYENIGGISNASAYSNTDGLLSGGDEPTASFTIELVACSPAKYDAATAVPIDSDGEVVPAYHSNEEDLTATIGVEQTFLTIDSTWAVSLGGLESSDYSSFTGEDGLVHAARHNEWMEERREELSGFIEALETNLNNTTEGSTPTLSRYAIQDCIVDAMKETLAFDPEAWDAHAGFDPEDKYEDRSFKIVWPDPDDEDGYSSTNDGFSRWDSTMDSLDECLNTWEQASKDYADLSGNEEMFNALADYLTPGVKEARAIVLRTAKTRGCVGTPWLTPLGALRERLWVEASEDEEGNEVRAHVNTEAVADLLGGGEYYSGKRRTSCSGHFFQGKVGTWNEWGTKKFGDGSGPEVSISVANVIGMMVSGDIENFDGDDLNRGIRGVLGGLSLDDLRCFCDEGEVDAVLASLKKKREMKV